MVRLSTAFATLVALILLLFLISSFDCQSTTTQKIHYGRWLPYESYLSRWRRSFAARCFNSSTPYLNPLVQAFYDTVIDDPLLRMSLTRSIQEAISMGYDLGYTTIGQLMTLINYAMTYAPPFDTTSLVGFPINALLDWPMCMPSGYAFFRSPVVNEHFRAILDYYGSFLSSPYSRTYLNEASPSGWFSPEALGYVNMSLFQSDVSRPYYGYDSFNDFFTRRLRYGARELASPCDNSIVANPCESSPYNLQYNVSLTDSFWIKSQPYSLRDMFTPAYEDTALRFVGGVVYQAFLNAYLYHRWHAPVSGRVTSAYLVSGTYYSDVESAGLDPAGPNDSMGYISHTATRAVLVIRADSHAIGTVAVVFVGMAEVSSCVFTVRVGDRVTKGQEVGYFQYGGSTFCLVFERGVINSFVVRPPFDSEAPVLQVLTKLAEVNM